MNFIVKNHEQRSKRWVFASLHLVITSLFHEAQRGCLSTFRTPSGYATDKHFTKGCRVGTSEIKTIINHSPKVHRVYRQGGLHKSCSPFFCCQWEYLQHTCTTRWHGIHKSYIVSHSKRNHMHECTKMTILWLCKWSKSNFVVAREERTKRW